MKVRLTQSSFFNSLRLCAIGIDLVLVLLARAVFWVVLDPASLVLLFVLGGWWCRWVWAMSLW